MLPSLANGVRERRYRNTLAKSMPTDWTFADLDTVAMDNNGPRPAQPLASDRCPKTSILVGLLDYDGQASSLLSRRDEDGVANLML
jgi:hypothetical protein